jgi:hypothetical protein
MTALGETEQLNLAPWPGASAASSLSGPLRTSSSANDSGERLETIAHDLDTTPGSIKTSFSRYGVQLLKSVGRRWVIRLSEEASNVPPHQTDLAGRAAAGRDL